MKKACEMIASKGDKDAAMAYVKKEIELLRTRQVHVSQLRKRGKLSKDIFDYGQELKTGKEEDPLSGLTDLIDEVLEKADIKRKVSILPIVRLARNEMIDETIHNIQQITQETHLLRVWNDDFYDRTISEGQVSITIGTDTPIDTREQLTIIHNYVEVLGKLYKKFNLVSPYTVKKTLDNLKAGTKGRLMVLTCSQDDAIRMASFRYSEGDYVSYVIIATDDKKARVSDQIATPEDVMNNDMPWDVHRYLKDLCGPLLSLFGGILGYGRKPGTLPHKLLEEKPDKKTGQMKFKLSNTQKRELTKIFFGAELIKNVPIAKPILKSSPLYKHLQEADVCLGCGEKLNDFFDNKAQQLPLDLVSLPKAKRDALKKNLCKRCIRNHKDLGQEMKNKTRQYEEKKERCKAKCIKCIGEGSEGIIDKCINMSCKNFIDKYEVNKDLHYCQEKLSVLDF